MTRVFLICGFLMFQIISFSQDFNAELLNQETNIYAKKGKLVSDIYNEIRINNRAGEEYTKVTIPYSKLIEIGDLKAYIKDSDGNIVKRLKKSDITERSAIAGFSFYEDNFVKEFTLKHNAYPYTIVYSYQLQQNEFFYIDYWCPVLDIKIPTLRASLTLTVPPDYNISYSNQHVEAPGIDTSENSIVYTWKTNYTNILEQENFSPPVHEFLPAVIIVPIDFKFETEGSFESWNSYGNWQYGLLQGINSLPYYENNKILSLIYGIEDDKEKIRTLYHYLQDATRYINISIETGGLKPYPADYVAQNKYGDCKALTNYFKSVLEYIGIKAYYSKVYAGNPINVINKELPSQQSNHIILFIPLEDENIWLDCTSDGPFNYLGTFSQNRAAFVIDKDNSRFIHTPSLGPKDVLELRKIDISYEPILGTSLSFENTYKGDMYEDILDKDHRLSEPDKTRYLKKYIFENGLELIDYSIQKAHRDSSNIRLSYNAHSRNIYKFYGKDLLISNIPFTFPLFEKPAYRKLPLQFDYPIQKTDTITYTLPPGYVFTRNPENHSISTKYGNYKISFKVEEDKVQVRKSLLIFSGSYPLTEYNEFYSFFRRIGELENRTHISPHK